MFKKILGGFSVLLLAFAIVMPLHTSANTHPSTTHSREIPKPLTPGAKILLQNLYSHL